jgi:hypothetical protein
MGKHWKKSCAGSTPGVTVIRVLAGSGPPGSSACLHIVAALGQKIIRMQWALGEDTGGLAFRIGMERQETLERKDLGAGRLKPVLANTLIDG